MKTSITTIFSLTLMLAFSSNAIAYTYQYINTSGNIASVEAESTSQALITAPNIDPHSGVMLYSLATAVPAKIIDNSQTLPYVTYKYVNTTGQIQTVVASSADQAFSLATNIAPTSGVMRVEAYQENIL